MSDNVVELDGANLAERRVQQSKEARREMHLYNLDAFPMPKSYIQFHREIAADILAALVAKYKLRVVEDVLRPSGWFDGMMDTNVIVEDSHGRVHKLVYCDSNQGFLRQSDGGGQGYFDPEKTFRR